MRVHQVFPKVGEMRCAFAWIGTVKPGGVWQFPLTEEGLPMLKDGTSSKAWKLVEDVP